MVITDRTNLSVKRVAELERQEKTLLGLSPTCGGGGLHYAPPWRAGGLFVSGQKDQFSILGAL